MIDWTVLNTLWAQWDNTTAATAFALISAAEIGDKSQLVCMGLAARYRAAPVLWGAIVAFMFLNGVAVSLGAWAAHSLPQVWLAAAVAVLFGAFGLHALWAGADDDEEDAVKTAPAAHSLFVSTLLLITLAEFGDKTQLAVAGFSSTQAPLPVWVGATLALSFTSALGVWAGRTLLQRLPVVWLHRISGVLFIALALAAALRVEQLLRVS